MYKENSANYPRLKTDAFFINYKNEYKYEGFVDGVFRFLEDSQLLRADLWERFVRQFREDADYDGGWRGEYWGKMMRGACFVYSYTKNEELYKILTKTVEDMMASADETGRISSFAKDHELEGWDLWCRKYVLLGMQYFLEICTDDALYNKIIASLRGQADYIISKIGREEGKKDFAKASRNFRGLNSASILEPMVRMYSLTKNEKYLEFAQYIVDAGGTDVENIFELAYKREMYPYQYPVTKAYEMTSCFEGLLEFYRITGIEKHLISVINFAEMILETDFTVVGGCGCTHEFFDHSTVRQANTNNYKMQQETCVTVTLMKFMSQMVLITGDSKYVDAFERSLYNAYLGALNTERMIEPLIKEEFPQCIEEAMPFDSYAPLTAGVRGNGVGGLKVMSDNHYYGCCACIGSAGIGLVPKMQLLNAKNGFAINLFINGKVRSTTPAGKVIEFVFETEYPRDGEVNIKINMEENEEFELLIRNPDWSEVTYIDGKIADMGYNSMKKVWKNGDEITIILDMRTRAIYPIPYGNQILMSKVIWEENITIPIFDREDELAHRHIALQRGPVMLAQENRLGYNVDNPIDIKVTEKDYVDVELCESEEAPYDNMVTALVPLADGTEMMVTDYASAGKLWNEECKMAVWMLTK